MHNFCDLFYLLFVATFHCTDSGHSHVGRDLLLLLLLRIEIAMVLMKVISVAIISGNSSLILNSLMLSKQCQCSTFSLIVGKRLLIARLTLFSHIVLLDLSKWLVLWGQSIFWRSSFGRLIGFTQCCSRDGVGFIEEWLILYDVLLMMMGLMIMSVCIMGRIRLDEKVDGCDCLLLKTFKNQLGIGPILLLSIMLRYNIMMSKMTWCSSWGNDTILMVSVATNVSAEFLISLCHLFKLKSAATTSTPFVNDVPIFILNAGDLALLEEAHYLQFGFWGQLFLDIFLQAAPHYHKYIIINNSFLTLFDIGLEELHELHGVAREEVEFVPLDNSFEKLALALLDFRLAVARIIRICARGEVRVVNCRRGGGEQI